MEQRVLSTFIRLPEIKVKKDCASEKKITVHKKIETW